MKIIQISPSKFLDTFSPSEIFWRDQNDDGTVLTLLAARLVGSVPIVWGTIKADSAPMIELIDTLDISNRYVGYDDGTGSTYENDGILAAVLSLTPPV